MEDLNKKFDQLYEVISNEEFLNVASFNQGTPFFITTYNARHEVKVRKFIRALKKKLGSHEITVLEINLFDISCEVLNRNGLLQRMLEMEKEIDFQEFLEAIQSSLNISEVLRPKIEGLINDRKDSKVYFLTGIGLVHPFLFLHNVLSNLEHTIQQSPLVTFFPGDYNEHTLRLFGLLRNRNYYRAIKI